MPEEIQEYHVVTFGSQAACVNAIDRMMLFIGSPQGTEWMVDPAKRAVIWIGDAVCSDGTLYLSLGALLATQAAGLIIQPSQVVSPAELPSDCTLMLGKSGDWH